ncbi:epoxide hydrolase N-terminal domain-containing protein [Mesorhizobium sp. M1163]|uniref:epoxide hydrolase N-terminal domain-containing protein n=1 Tax=Mesorhizobium sp. M1163 TaxID=2957065 RepID=UPI00333A8D32
MPLVQELARIWRNDFDWRAVEALLNELPHFTTNIDGLDIHKKGVGSNSRPLLLTMVGLARSSSSYQPSRF